MNYRQKPWKARLVAIAISMLVLLSLPVAAATYSLADDTQPEPLVPIKGPYLQNMTTTSVTICWETEAPVRGKVEYGLTTAYGNVKSDTNPFSQHEITLTGLTPSTTYHYRVGANDLFTEDTTFTTAVEFTEPFTFAVYTDAHSGGSERADTTHADVLSLIKKNSPNFYIHTGDIVNKSDRQADWDAFFNTSKDMMRNIPLFPIRGNHDGNGVFTRYFSLPGNEQWYSFTYGNSYFIVLNGNGWRDFEPGKEQYNWLENELKIASTKAKWKFVFIHFGPYTTTQYDENIKQRLKEKIAPLFEAYGVNMVFSGHDHIYEHNIINGVHYIIGGTGGGAIREPGTDQNWTVHNDSVNGFSKVHIDGSSLNFQYIRSPNATIVESFSLSLSRLPVLLLSSTPVGEITSLQTPITITFGQLMNHTSVENAFSISPPVRGVFSWEGNTMTFTPTNSLSSGETYTVTIPKEITDLQGNSMIVPYSWQFTTPGLPSQLHKAIIIIIALTLALIGNLIFWTVRKRRLRS